MSQTVLGEGWRPSTSARARGATRQTELLSDGAAACWVTVARQGRLQRTRPMKDAAAAAAAANNLHPSGPVLTLK